MRRIGTQMSQTTQAVDIFVGREVPHSKQGRELEPRSRSVDILTEADCLGSSLKPKFSA